MNLKNMAIKGRKAEIPDESLERFINILKSQPFNDSRDKRL